MPRKRVDEDMVQARWVKLQAQTANGDHLATRQGWYFYRGASETFIALNLYDKRAGINTLYATVADKLR